MIVVVTHRGLFEATTVVFLFTGKGAPDKGEAKPPDLGVIPPPSDC